MTKPEVSCEKHGKSEAVFVCDHTVDSLDDNKPRGLHLWYDDNGSTCGWCDACDAAVAAREANPSLPRVPFRVGALCQGCFAPLKDLNKGGVWDR